MSSFWGTAISSRPPPPPSYYDKQFSSRESNTDWRRWLCFCCCWDPAESALHREGPQYMPGATTDSRPPRIHLFPSFPKLPPSASLVSPTSVIHPDFLDPLSSRLLLVPWLLLLSLHTWLLTKHRPLKVKSDHVTPFLKPFNAFPLYFE